jgi:hypothetical protein
MVCWDASGIILKPFLLLHHIMWMANYFNDPSLHAHDCSGHLEAHPAALTLVLTSLAWLCTMQNFGL